MGEKEKVSTKGTGWRVEDTERIHREKGNIQEEILSRKREKLYRGRKN